jgi:hypothetical protein
VTVLGSVDKWYGLPDCQGNDTFVVCRGPTLSVWRVPR